MPPETTSIRAQRLCGAIRKRLPPALLALALAAFPTASFADVVFDTVAPGRKRETKPPYWCTPEWAKRNATLPEARLLELFWIGVVAWTGPGSENFVPPVVPDLVMLRIPRGYSRDEDNLHVQRSSGASFSATYPSFAPFSCDDADRVEVVFGLQPKPAPEPIKGSLHEHIAATWQSESRIDAHAVPVPPASKMDSS